MQKPTQIDLSPRVKQLLEKIVNQAKCPQCLAKRTRIILLASDDLNNTQISKKLELSRWAVRLWRDRWAERSGKIEEIENDKEAAAFIKSILRDEYRPGAPSDFSPEQVVQIVAIALESPEDSGLPINRWTQSAIAKEAEKRNIVKKISQRSVGRFLKTRSI